MISTTLRRITSLSALLLVSWMATPCAHAQTRVATPLQIPAPQPIDYPGIVQLSVDASRIANRYLDVEQVMPVKAGPLVLYFPKFLPGTHGPNGDVGSLAGLTIHVDDAPKSRVTWSRDLVDPQAFHVTVPVGAKNLTLKFQHIAPTSSADGRVTITPAMANIQWNAALLYPAGHDSDRIRFQARLKLPAGWQGGTGLRVEKTEGDWTTYRATSLETLVDSPVFAGAHTQRVVLSDAAPKVELFVMADEPDQLKASAAQWQAHKNLVAQADKLFGSRPFRQYDFLLALTDHMGRIGLEHHESSENGVHTGYFKDWKLDAAGHSTGGIGARELLPHEYVHAWNGKYRRPADLLTVNFNIPMRNSLLWVYEGQTQYWGRVLAARSGLTSLTQTLSLMAQSAASAEARAGRVWRNLQDTTNEGTINSRRNKVFSNWQRTGGDYYEEATLIWLDADTLIRSLSRGQRSLDDFARAFFGAPHDKRADGSVAPRPYTFDDVAAALSAVQPLPANTHPGGWAKFLRERLDSNDAAAPLEGIARAGYKLVWKDAPSEVYKGNEAVWKVDDLSYSLGLSVASDGKVTQVMWGSPAFDAGINNASLLLAVNGLAYKPERLKAAIAANKDGKSPIQLIVRDADSFKSLSIDYRGGLRYPFLERVVGVDAPDGLAAVLSVK